MAFVKALAGQGCSDCWEKCLLTRLDCSAFLAELQDLLPTPDSESVSNKKEMKIF